MYETVMFETVMFEYGVGAAWLGATWNRTHHYKTCLEAMAQSTVHASTARTVEKYTVL